LPFADYLKTKTRFPPGKEIRVSKIAINQFIHRFNYRPKQKTRL